MCSSSSARVSPPGRFLESTESPERGGCAKNPGGDVPPGLSYSYPPEIRIIRRASSCHGKGTSVMLPSTTDGTQQRAAKPIPFRGTHFRKRFQLSGQGASLAAILAPARLRSYRRRSQTLLTESPPLIRRTCAMPPDAVWQEVPTLVISYYAM